MQNFLKEKWKVFTMIHMPAKIQYIQIICFFCCLNKTSVALIWICQIKSSPLHYINDTIVIAGKTLSDWNPDIWTNPKKTFDEPMA